MFFIINKYMIYVNINKHYSPFGEYLEDSCFDSSQAQKTLRVMNLSEFFIAALYFYATG